METETEKKEEEEEKEQRERNWRIVYKEKNEVKTQKWQQETKNRCESWRSELKKSVRLRKTLLSFGREV